MAAETARAPSSESSEAEFGRREGGAGIHRWLLAQSLYSSGHVPKRIRPGACSGGVGVRHPKVCL